MKNIASLLVILVLSACGVRNDPIPPGTQAEIGHGRPSPKAWLEDKTENIDPSKLQVLDYLEESGKQKKKNEK